MVLKIAAIFATHNRSEITRTFLETLTSLESKDLELSIFALDDGSSDDTRFVLQQFVKAENIFYGHGDLYWAKSMSFLQGLVNSKPYFDGTLLLNDDILLFEDALLRLAESIKIHPNSIITGAFVDKSGDLSYSGLRRKGRSFYVLHKIGLKSGDEDLDSFVGNFTYIPRIVEDAIGLLKGHYGHHYADVEYGIRARKNGIRIVQLSGAIGMCESNTTLGSFELADGSVIERLKLLNSRKQFPIRDHLRFFKDIGGPLAYLFFLRSYLPKICRAIMGARKKIS